MEALAVHTISCAHIRPPVSFRFLPDLEGRIADETWRRVSPRYSSSILLASSHIRFNICSISYLIYQFVPIRSSS